jgi:hypothetical protein
MTLNRDLFLSILAMDSYNRGYGSGVNLRGDLTRIGNATLRPFGEDEQQGWQAAGFYALAYDMSGVSGFELRENYGDVVDGALLRV